MNFGDIINTNGFSIDALDLTEIRKMSEILPKNKVIDSNIAEKYIISTIEAQDLCQEKIVQVERWIGMKKVILEKTEAESALIRAKDAGHKTAKEKEWFVQCDEAVIALRDELEKAKVAKLWLDNKIKYFSMWHYSLKAFIKRDYNIEGASTYSTFGTTPDQVEMEEAVDHVRKKTNDICGDIDWK